MLKNEYLESLRKGDTDNCIKVCREAISLSQKNSPQWFAYNIFLVGHLISSNDKDISRGMEEALNIALEIQKEIDFKKMPKRWGDVHIQLGFIYDHLEKRNKLANKIQAIKNYELAQKYYTKKEYPEDWAMLKARLGAIRSEIVQDEDIKMLGEVIKNLKDALTVYVNTKEKYGEEYKDTMELLNYSEKLMRVNKKIIKTRKQLEKS